MSELASERVQRSDRVREADERERGGVVDDPDHTDSAAYKERLRVPASWWLVALAFVASVWWVFFLATPLWVAWLAAGVALGGAAGLIGRYGAARLAVAGGQLLAGRAHIPIGLCGAVEALDSEQTRRAGGADADARAYLLLRPYIPTAVRVAIDDPNDPVPYWLLSTRHPERLAAAVEAERRAVG